MIKISHIITIIIGILFINRHYHHFSPLRIFDLSCSSVRYIIEVAWRFYMKHRLL